MRRASSSSDPQSTIRTQMQYLKYYVEFDSINLYPPLLPYYTTVTLRFMPGYRLTQSEYTPEVCWVLWTFHFPLKRGTFDLCHLNGASVHTLRGNLLPGTLAHVNWVTTLRRVIRRALVSQRGIVSEQHRKINSWSSVLEIPEVLWNGTLSLALQEGQEVESYVKTRKQRVS